MTRYWLCGTLKTLAVAALALPGQAVNAQSAQPQSAQAAATRPAAVTTSVTLDKLRQQHPRLIALDEDIRETSRVISSNPEFLARYHTIRKSAEALLNEPPVEHKLDGPRLLTQSRRALDRITLLGFMHRMEPDPRYVKRAVLEMETACAFPDWNPSHFLDTAEMTAAMGIGYDWFYHDLTPKTRKTVADAIVQKGLRQGIRIHKARRIHWLRSPNNWNQVCNGGLIIGALAIADDRPKVSLEMLNYAVPSLYDGMMLFAPDGAWIEASGYWHYTMIYTARALSALQTAMGTTYGLDEAPGFKNTGYFMLAMRGPSGKYFNWGDCSEKLGNVPEFFWLARHFDQPISSWMGHQHMSTAPGVMDLLWYTPKQTPPDASTPLDFYFRDSEVVSLREAWNNPSASWVALKGGKNAASHSNLDLGSFVFEADGERWAIELGGDNYNLPNYWNRVLRLAYYRLRTAGQNTLVLNGHEQKLNAESKLVHSQSTPEESVAVIDLTDAYSQDAVSARREFRLAGGRKHLVITDDLHTTQPLDLQWTMHTRAAGRVQGKSVVLSQGKKSATLTVLEPAGAFLTFESAEQGAPNNPNKGIQKVMVRHKFNQIGPLRVRVQISPGSAAQ